MMFLPSVPTFDNKGNNTTTATTATTTAAAAAAPELRHPYPYVKPQRTRTALDRPLPHLLYCSTSPSLLLYLYPPLPLPLCLFSSPCLTLLF